MALESKLRTYTNVSPSERQTSMVPTPGTQSGKPTTTELHIVSHPWKWLHYNPIFRFKVSSAFNFSQKKISNPLLQISSWNIITCIINTIIIVFCWKSSHVGIKCKTEADKLARITTMSYTQVIPIPPSDAVPTVGNYISTKWQATWSLSQTTNYTKYFLRFHISHRYTTLIRQKNNLL